MGTFSSHKVFGVTIRESADDGSDFTNPDADYRRLFLGEDGTLKTKNSAGSVVTVASGDVAAHLADTSDAHDASAVSFDPTGLSVISATEVQPALEELDAAVGGGGATWTQDINVSGSSATGWTAQNGTWSSTGSVIQNTDAGAANKWFRWDTKIAQGFPTIYEAECKVVSGGGLVGLTMGYNGATNTGGLWVGIADTANKVSIEAPAAVAEVNSYSTTITTGTFYKVRIVRGSGYATVYLDGTLLGTTEPATQSGAAAPWDYVALRCHTAAAEFRNIKLWTLSGGAPA